MALDTGAVAPDFTLPTDDGGSVTLSALRGQPVVVYFYPKDDTPGCTKEAIAFNEHLEAFTGANAKIIGISKDDAASHVRFKEKYDLNFTLATDADGAVHDAYGAWGEKNMYGKKSMGVIRSTVLIDGQGKVIRAWRNVRVPGHAEKVLAELKLHGG